MKWDKCPHGLIFGRDCSTEEVCDTCNEFERCLDDLAEYYGISLDRPKRRSRHPNSFKRTYKRRRRQ